MNKEHLGSVAEDLRELAQLFREVGGALPVGLAAALKGVSRQSLLRRIKRGTVGTVRIKGTVLVLVDDLTGGGADLTPRQGGNP